MPSAPP